MSRMDMVENVMSIKIRWSIKTGITLVVTFLIGTLLGSILVLVCTVLIRQQLWPHQLNPPSLESIVSYGGLLGLLFAGRVTWLIYVAPTSEK